MKKTNLDTSGTSYFHHDVAASVNTLIALFGEPQEAHNDGEDKCNFMWDMETSDGRVFTIYDWKEYRVLDLDETIYFHIGGFSPYDTAKASFELINLLKK